jgi:hypothetical protein
MKSNQGGWQYGNWLRATIVLLWVGLFIAWTVLLLVPVPSEAVRVVGGPKNSFWVSKILHVSVYAIFALLVTWLPVARRWRFLLIVLLIIHGGATEYLQQFVHRGSSWRDFGLDSLGVSLGFLLGWRRWRGDALRHAPQIQLQDDTAREHENADHLR